VRIRNVLILLGAVFFGLVMVPYLLIGLPQRMEERKFSHDRYVAPNVEKIRSALVDRLGHPDPVCLATVHFPYESGKNAAKCDLCDALVDAGLLSRTAGTAVSNEQERVAVRYDLTPLGSSLYTTRLRDRRSENFPGFCFGRTLLSKVDIGRPLRSGRGMVVGLSYAAEIADPHPLLYQPVARALQLPVIERGRPLLEPRRACAYIAADAVFQNIDDCQ